MNLIDDKMILPSTFTSNLSYNLPDRVTTICTFVDDTMYQLIFPSDRHPPGPFVRCQDKWFQELIEYLKFRFRCELISWV